MKALFVTLVAFVACVAFAPLSALGDTWGQPINDTTRFVVLASYNNEAVLDRETGLVWEQSPSTFTMTWDTAHNHCLGAQKGNRRGWRVPTIQELFSLVDPTQSNPALPPGHPFSGVLSAPYWSATSFDSAPGSAWLADFTVGGRPGFLKTDSANCWCVRGGQGVDHQ